MGTKRYLHLFSLSSRFVDEPQENVGKSMEDVFRSTQDKARSIQKIVAPHVVGDGVSFDASKSKRGMAAPFGGGGSISYSHGKSLEKKIERRKKNLKSEMVLEHQPELGPRSR